MEISQFPLPPPLVPDLDPSDTLDPGFVVCHPHVDSREIWVGTLNTMGNSSSKHPLSIWSQHCQRTTAVTLIYYKN